ncbi:MAG: hypothetical protein CXR30_05425 [Geobacter sp.]|nr:MAG: hypothetical protein CXR30_05425 [Geobacter sp.]
MSAPDFISGNGEVILKDKFVSVRLVGAALEKKFRLKIIEESPKFIKFKIVRFARIYGAPVFWPSASLSIAINNENDSINYKFYWPDYYMLLLLVGLVLFVPGIKTLKEDFLFPLITVIFWAGIIFLDTKYVSSKVRKTLLKLSST